MWPFKDKEEPKEESKITDAKASDNLVPVKVLDYQKSEKFNVGKTTIRIVFDDKKKFDTVVYGGVAQYTRPHFKNTEYDGGYKYDDAVVDKVMLNSSENEAKLFLTHLDGNFVKTITDFPMPDTTKSVCGKVVSAQIKKTEDHYIDFFVAYLRTEMMEKK